MLKLRNDLEMKNKSKTIFKLTRHLVPGASFSFSSRILLQTSEGRRTTLKDTEKWKTNQKIETQQSCFLCLAFLRLFASKVSM